MIEIRKASEADIPIPLLFMNGKNNLNHIAVFNDSIYESRWLSEVVGLAFLVTTALNAL